MKENGWSFLPSTTCKRQSGYLITRLREQHHTHPCQNTVLVRRVDSFLQRSFFNFARRAEPMSGDNYFSSRRALLFGGSDGSLGPERKTLSLHQARALGFKTRRVFHSGGIAKRACSGGISTNVFGFTSHWQTADQRRRGEGAQAGSRVSPLTSASDLITVWRNLAGIRDQPYKVWTTDPTAFEAIY